MLIYIKNMKPPLIANPKHMCQKDLFRVHPKAKPQVFQREAGRQDEHWEKVTFADLANFYHLKG